MTMKRPTDWAGFDSFPENTCECTCGAVFRSHSRYSHSRGLISRIPCPTCGKDDALRKASSDVERVSIGRDKP